MPAITIPVFLTFNAEERATAVQSAKGLLFWMNDTLQPDPDEDGRFLSADAWVIDAEEMGLESPEGSAYRAGICLEACRELDPGDEEDEALRLSDLLANLLHYADQNGLDFDTCLDRARGHHAYETEIA